MNVNVGKKQGKDDPKDTIPIKIMLHQQQRTSVQYINYFDSMITDDAKCKREIPSRIVMETSSIQQEEGSFQEQFGLKFKEETSNVLHLEHSFFMVLNLDTSKGEQK